MSRGPHIVGVRKGTFVRAKRARGKQHVTLHVEGDDQDGPSVSGIGLTLEQLSRLICRLSNLERSILEERDAELYGAR